MFAPVCVEAHQYLLARSLFASEILRQFVFAEIFCFGRFDIRNEFAADNGAENENFNDPVGVYWLVVLVPVLNGDEPVRSDAQSRLYKSLFHGVLRDRLIDIAPAAGKRVEKSKIFPSLKIAARVSTFGV